MAESKNAKVCQLTWMRVGLFQSFHTLMLFPIQEVDVKDETFDEKEKHLLKLKSNCGRYLPSERETGVEIVQKQRTRNDMKNNPRKHDLKLPVNFYPIYKLPIIGSTI